MATHTATEPVVDPAQFVHQRRHGTRQSLEAPATLFDESAPFLSPGVVVRVSNISMAGIGFLSKNPAEVDSTHRIHLVTGIMRLNSRIRVTRCDDRDGSYDIGAEFIED
jgi:hypothetical protein